MNLSALHPSVPRYAVDRVARGRHGVDWEIRSLFGDALIRAWNSREFRDAEALAKAECGELNRLSGFRGWV